MYPDRRPDSRRPCACARKACRSERRSRRSSSRRACALRGRRAAASPLHSSFRCACARKVCRSERRSRRSSSRHGCALQGRKAAAFRYPPAFPAPPKRSEAGRSRGLRRPHSCASARRRPCRDYPRWSETAVTMPTWSARPSAFLSKKARAPRSGAPVV